MARGDSIAHVLGGTRTVRGNTANWVLILRRGLPYASFEALRKCLAISQESLAKVLHMPARTLSRRRGKYLRPDESDRLFRLARVFTHAIGVFENEAQAASWMQRSNRALAGIAPIHLFDTDFGAEQVDTLLSRVEHGVFA